MAIGRVNTGGGSAGALPTFSYTGNYALDPDSAPKAWVLRLLTSGTLTFTSDAGLGEGIDVFLCGGGGGGGQGGDEYGQSVKGGGGGGRTNTHHLVSPAVGSGYAVTIGGGGGQGSGGGTTTFGTGLYSAAGGNAGGLQAAGAGTYGARGGNGGSGGGATERAGGSDGGPGVNLDSQATGGTGQGESTREFGEATGRLYASGGCGSAPWNGGAGFEAGMTTPGDWSGEGILGTNIVAGSSKPANARANTGTGGSGGYSSGSGGSGIVAIRNHRG